MAVITGTVLDITQVPHDFRDDIANNSRRVLVTLRVGSAAATGSDTGKVVGIAAAVTAAMRDGRTYTLRDGFSLRQGEDSSGGAVYANTVAVSSLDLTYNLNTTPSASTAGAVNATAVPFFLGAVLDGTLP